MSLYSAFLSLLLVLLPAGVSSGVYTGLDEDDLPVNHPTLCPYCKGDPELMAASGIVSHGGFEFATKDTAAVDDFLSTNDVRWIESEHFEIGIALGNYKPKEYERKKFRAELEELAKVLPEIKPKTKQIDPWLRAHLYAVRAERVWDRFLEIIRVDESVFPPADEPWDTTGKYWGAGPYLGQDGKYELLILPSEAASVSFLREYYGLTIKKTQRWNCVERDSLSVTIHTQQENLRVDSGLHNHVAFNLTVNFVDGLKHYSYDTPVWFHEGLAHMVEREVSPRWNSFDSGEGGTAEMTRKDNWEPPTRKLVVGEDAPRMAELAGLKSYAELELPHHYTTWSMVEYLYKVHPEALAGLLDGMKGRVNVEGYPDSSNLEDAHRQLFKDLLGMSYAQFDQAWSAWVLENYSSR